MLKTVWIKMMAAVVILMAGWGWMPGEMVSEAAQEKDIQWPGLEVYGDDWGEIDRFLQREAGFGDDWSHLCQFFQYFYWE